MKSTKLAQIAIVFSIALLAINCGKSEKQTAEDKADAYAEASDENTLRSPKFGLTVRKPEGWHSLEYDDINDLMETGTDVATAGQDDLRAVVEASEKNSYTLFGIMQYENGAAVDENPNVMGVAENVRHAPGVKTGEDYFFHTKKLMAQANPNFVIEEGYKKRMIGGVQFDQMDLSVDVGAGVTNQSYYAAKYENFMVVIIQTYVSEEGKAATSGIIDTIELDW